ncbi:ABC-three component system protein [Metamycoplasma hominis]|uniref:ABC-three component system protein n=1 Tax=Metamycoplasma hominis TaxID=2098 RepID=UPI003979581A
MSDLDTISPVCKTELQIHREDSYSAESVLHKIRDFFFDAEREFNCLKDDVYNGIKLFYPSWIL